MKFLHIWADPYLFLHLRQVGNTGYFEKRQKEIMQPVETVPIPRISQLYVKTKLMVIALILK